MSDYRDDEIERLRAENKRLTDNNILMARLVLILYGAGAGPEWEYQYAANMEQASPEEIENMRVMQDVMLQQRSELREKMIELQQNMLDEMRSMLHVDNQEPPIN